MRWRAVAGVVAGFVAWWVVFIVIGIGFGLLWPAYREAARPALGEGDFSAFSTAMLLLNFGLFTIVGLLTAWLVWLIGRSRIAVWVVALLYLLLMTFDHYVMVWGRAPDWYNIVVPLVISGSIAIGGLLLGSARSATRES